MPAFTYRSALTWIKRNMKFVNIVCIPIVFSPIPLVLQNNESYCGWVLLVMSFYWLSECLPLAVTSLLPVVLFPMLGILSSKCTAQIYFQDIQMLFFGSLVMAIGIESSGLHQKIALKILLWFGSDPKWLMLGIMYVTGFLSLWIQNTAAASMMLPIVIALVKQLSRYNKAFSGGGSLPEPSGGGAGRVNMGFSVATHESQHDTKNSLEMNQIVAQMNNNTTERPQSTGGANDATEEDLPNTEAAHKLMKGFCLAIAYSASTGGAGSLVGTTPNLLLKGYMDDKYPDGGLNFLTYFAYALPVSVIMITSCWIVLAFLWLPRSEFFKMPSFKKNKINASKVKIDDPLTMTIRKKYVDLGPMTWEQISVAFLFMLLVVLWLTRDLYFVDGWQAVFGAKKSFVTDTTPAMLIVLLLFIWPKENIFDGKPYGHLITWKNIDKDFPWDVILLGGGSLALAEGFQKSGLSQSIGVLLKNVVPKERYWALLIIIVFSEFGTEFTSNTSMASIFIPIADSVARANNIKAIYFLLPLTVGVSLAYVFPVATPPNTIVFGSGYIQVKDMVKSGLFLKIFGILVVFGSANLWLDPIFPMPASQLQLQLNFMNMTMANETMVVTPPVCACP